MALEFRSTSKWWYGRYNKNGKRFCVNLGVAVAGTPPASLREEGDTAFERSRATAQAKLDRLASDAQKSVAAEAMVQTLYEIKYGATIESVPVADLISFWDKMPKKKKSQHPRYVSAVHATIQRFMSFIRDRHPKVEDAGQVTRAIALEFMKLEDERGLAAKSWNDSLKRLRSVFKFLQEEQGLPKNPFDGIKARSETHVHRKPLSKEEAGRLLEAAQQDDFVRPLIVCGLCTAMRRGDCCLLTWDAVKLDDPHPSITVKTSKTGEVVCIPVAPLLLNELQAARKKWDKKSAYVWPEQAEMQLNNQQGVSWRIGQVFKAAGFSDDECRSERTTGVRRASVRDFHSLRTTWITEALSNGVPIETVKLISGHRTTDVVTEHYFHPNQEKVRSTLQQAMPDLFQQKEKNSPSPKADLLTITKLVKGMNSKNWRERKKAILEQLADLA